MVAEMIERKRIPYLDVINVFACFSVVYVFIIMVTCTSTTQLMLVVAAYS
jgi:surface polysaccharide O-acyltransferase-like enzyme